MKYRAPKTWIAAILVLSMLAPMFTNLNVHASEEVVDTFFILDENGDPVTIEITQSDLDNFERENNTYAISPASEESEQSTEEIIGIVRFNRDVTTFNYTEVDSGRTGYLSPLLTGDAAYLSTQEDGIVCFVSGVKILVDPDDVAEIVSYEDEIVSDYYTANGYLIHNYSYFDGGDTPKQSTTRVGLAPSYLEDGVHYYSYDGHYFYETFETMIEDYKNDVRDNAVNAGKPHYNYYQYLSFHTTAVYTGDEYDAYVSSKIGESSVSAMRTTGDEFVEVQDTYTINSVLMLGIAINESGWGRSTLATEKNNLFGLNAVDSNPYEEGKSFSSTKACIEDFAYGWIHSGYLSGTDSRYRGPHLGDKHSGINVKYASDPYWGEKGASRPYYFDEENEDYGRFTLGIAVSGEIKLYKEADTTSKVIYTSEAGSGGDLFDYPVVVLDTVTNDDGEVFYKLISDMSLKDDRSARNVTDQYKPSRDYVFAKASDIQIVFEGTGKNIIIPDPEELSEHVLEGHVYETEFLWAEDYSKCTVTFVCDECGISETKNCTITTEEIGSEIRYTAVCEFEGRTYTDSKEAVLLPFTDVSRSSWYYDAVEYVYVNGYMEGTTETTFAPGEILTRAQFATILYRLHGEPDVEYEAVFSDVEEGKWYTDGVIWAYKNQIVNGYGNGKFGTNDVITREQLTVMMYRYAEFLDYDTSEQADFAGFADSDKVSSFAEEGMRWAVGSGIVNGKASGEKTILDPQGESLRSECAAIIMRFCEKYAE